MFATSLSASSLHRQTWPQGIIIISAFIARQMTHWGLGTEVGRPLFAATRLEVVIIPVAAKEEEEDACLVPP